MDPWPRNIVPIDDARLRALATPMALTLFLSALDAPIPRAALGRIASAPQAEAEATARGLVEAGVLRLQGETFVAGPRHIREEDLDAPGKVAFHGAMLTVAQGIVTEASRTLAIMQDDARIGLGSVTIPGDADSLARAATILAETEDQLRALAEDAPDPDADRIRVLFLLATRPRDHAFSKTPQ